MIKITERGWPGHFVDAGRCLFRRNTLIEGNNDSVVVSTVGYWTDGTKIEPIGAFDRYYETMVFGAKKQGPYIDADISDERSFESNWSIRAEKELPEDSDLQANDMHEAVVAEFVRKLDK